MTLLIEQVFIKHLPQQQAGLLFLFPAEESQAGGGGGGVGTGMGSHSRCGKTGIPTQAWVGPGPGSPWSPASGLPFTSHDALFNPDPLMPLPSSPASARAPSVL